MPSPSEHQDPERHLWFSGNLMTIKHRRGWTFIESRMAAGHAPPLHVHRNEDEAFYVLEGSMRLARAAAPTMPTGQSIDREAVAAAAARHGIVEVGPPLALD